MITTIELAWAAGLLEGEGYFTWINGYPVVGVEMTDSDVIQAFAALFPGARGRKVMHRKNKDYSGKGAPRLDSYRYEIQGPNAVALMMTLFSFMGTRRKNKIEEMLLVWRSLPYYKSPGSIRSGANATTRRI